MKKSIAKRIKITKKGKIKRRPPILSHSRSNKKPIQLLRKRKERGLNMKLKVVKKIY
ncbi:MAG: 50S ribosomal protein L35 [Minisyncoccia bacterium]